MTGIVVCHGSPVVRERLVSAAQGITALAPARFAASGEELLVLARRQPPTIVLLDAHLPGTGPVEAIRRLRLMNVGAVIVMLAQPGDEIALDRAITLGARGFLAPDVGRAELAAVAAHVLSTPLSPQALARTVRADVPGPNDPLRRVLTDGVAVPELTKRELEVLSGMSHGRSNAQIGADLYLSEDTVKTHARRLFRKLSASDRAQAVAIGLRRGLIL
ncbi:LuxR C-terminal-related transcriptional regulator [Pengzhenrongella frigida]|uniref:Response regulator transcription factor n=1 Tax=Pengzhenrongella frigida TaxID=1259133 RepID=A0A4Q5N715_9MICO|nr:response regulator transcription factor [Cellulomonas sp. HLT2-17]RYV52181.1 response regulator transcription factor [Cellulomonas sp. HLT2-17]